LDYQSKILPLDSLKTTLAEVASDRKRVVLCHGVFDLLHLGHIRYFDQARKFGDLLVVTVTADDFVDKGNHRPILPELLRAEALAALAIVDYVAINPAPSAAEVIRVLRPAFYCKGGEFRQGELGAGLKAEIDAAHHVGTEVEFTGDNLLSSSNLINKHLNVFSPATEAWLKDFRGRRSIEEVRAYIEGSSSLKTLVVGESIIDEYVFCDPLGKSTKDPVLASLYHSIEAYAGGSLAVANNLAGFCDQVDLLTLLGESDRREEFVRDGLRPNVHPHFVTQQGAPTIHKRRFVDNHTNARMFELYTMNDTPLVRENEAVLVEKLESIVDQYDLVVVADYGHGMLTPATIERLCGSARFLAVNTQANAGNRGFNTVSRYPRADYVCVTMHEIALETRMRHADWRDLVREVIQRVDCPRFTITTGKDGSLHYTPEDGFSQAPALATHVTDRVGAGDALLAVTSLLVVQNAPWDIIGFVGGLAGAQMVSQLGVRKTVTRDSITRSAASLMK